MKNLEPKSGEDIHLGLACDIVSSFVSKNTVRPSEVAQLLSSVHAEIKKISRGGDPTGEASPSIEDTSNEETLVCLECGERFKMLRRHLKSAHGMEPHVYRRKHGLSNDYPLISEAYARRRRRLAKDLGLGKNRKSTRKGKKRARTNRRKGRF